MSKTPKCYIIAGPNGAGKTTFAMKYLPKIAGCFNFINADEIARGLSPLNVEAAQLPASRIFLKAIDEKIRLRENFAFETTLSGKAYLPKIKQWQREGWQVELFYLYLPSAAFSARRVEYRVQQGGHNIPADAIERRYPRSIKNLFEYAQVCDITYCVDNSQPEISFVFYVNAKDFKIYNETIFQQMRKFCHD